MMAIKAPPPPAPQLDIHGFFDVTFANDYMTPRGVLVTNTGLTTQIVNGLTFRALSGEVESGIPNCA